MGKITIEESGAIFGPFNEADLFHIEKSEILRKLGDKIKTVEFVVVRNDNQVLVFVEAKSTCPNAANRHKSKEKEKRYEEFFHDVVQKVEDSIRVTLAAILGRYGISREVGQNMQGLTALAKRPLQFVLVLTNTEIDISWLSGPKAELEKRLLSIRKTWGLEITVMNRELAETYHLITKQE